MLGEFLELKSVALVVRGDVHALQMRFGLELHVKVLKTLKIVSLRFEELEPSDMGRTID